MSTSENSLTAGTFKRKFPVEKRKLFLKKHLAKYGEDNVLVILEMAKNTSDFVLSSMQERTGEMTAGTKYKPDNKILLLNSSVKSDELLFKIRSVLHLQEFESLFLSLNGKVITPSHSVSVGTLAESHADPSDGILYMEYSHLQTLG